MVASRSARQQVAGSIPAGGFFDRWRMRSRAKKKVGTAPGSSSVAGREILVSPCCPIPNLIAVIGSTGL